VVVTALGIAACGSSSSTKSTTAASTPAPATPTVVAITTRDAAGGRFTVQAPTTVQGGLVTIQFANAAKAPHEAQLIRVDGTHTITQLLKVIATSGPTKIPAWIHAAGGVAEVLAGQQGSTTENLVAGHYFVTDTDTGSSDTAPAPSSRGAVAEFDVTAGTPGQLPATAGTIKISTPSKDHYQFEASGLTAGANRVLFQNDSEPDVIHHVVAFPILPGKTLADVKKALAASGPPSGPPPVDFSKASGTEVIDGKQGLVTTLTLARGHYALVCFLNDRDDLKPHFTKGALKEVTVE
jgi:hypothetical protein